jgi:integrase
MSRQLPVPSLVTTNQLHDLAESDLVEKVRVLVASSLSEGSKRAYAASWADWLSFAETHQFCALPARPECLALYLADRSSTLKVASLAKALSAIAHMHKSALGTIDSPTYHPLVRATFKGIRRTIGTAQTMKDPLLTPEIRRMVAACPDTLAGTRNKALVLVSYAGALRRSEAAALTVDDLTFCSEGLTITIRRSKTDPEAAGQTVGIPRGTDAATCAVRALHLYIDRAPIRSGALLRKIDQVGRVSPSGLHPDSIGRLLKTIAARAGLKNIDAIAGHSLRSGCVTQAARNHVPIYIIQRQTRHKSWKMLARYIRLGEMFTRNAASGLGL